MTGDGETGISNQDISDDIYESCMEEIVVNSSSDDDRPVIYTQVRQGTKSRKKNKELEAGYELLDAVIDASEVPILTVTSSKWKRKGTIVNALSLLEQLAIEEKDLKSESEKLFQENWKLRKRIEVFEKIKRKKRKRTSHVVTRSVSGSLGGDSKNTPDKGNKIDISKSNITPPKNPETPETDDQKSCSEIAARSTKRKPKKNTTGLNDEEKKFVELDEKIEDILHDVDALWNEVKDDPEDYDDDDDDSPDTKTEVKLVLPEVKRETEMEKKKQTFTTAPSNKPPAKKIIPKLVPVSKVISVKNISSLLKPECVERFKKIKEKEKEQNVQSQSANQESKGQDVEIIEQTNEDRLKKLTSQPEVIVISEGSDSETDTPQKSNGDVIEI